MKVTKENKSLHIVFVQHGDFREAWLNFQNGGEETYQAQRLSVDFVNELKSKGYRITIAIVKTADVFDETLPNGIRVVGLGPKGWTANWSKLLKEFSPNRLIVRTPHRPILRWAVRNQVRTLVTLADSFNPISLREKLRHRLLNWTLAHPQIEWVGNHGKSASLNLAQLGLPSSKIIPWDWPAKAHPKDNKVKYGINIKGPVRILFVGKMVESKGIDDLIFAAISLITEGYNIELEIAGSGNKEFYENIVYSEGVADRVKFLGSISNDNVSIKMKNSDIIVVPSRHDYPEGMPLTIYEAFVSRTPLIVSNHPMFVASLSDSGGVLFFEAGNVKDLCIRIKELVINKNLYKDLSENSVRAWEGLQLPVTWFDLVEHWLDDSTESREWIFSRNLRGLSGMPLT